MAIRQLRTVSILVVLIQFCAPVWADETRQDAERPEARKPLVQVEPRYPSEALSEGMPGRVRLRLRIEQDGTVRGVAVAAENPAEYGFGTEAAAAVRRWRFPSGHEGLYQVDVVFVMAD